MNEVRFECVPEDGKWRWVLKARNGKVIATSARTYKTQEDCLPSIDVIREEAADARVYGVGLKELE